MTSGSTPEVADLVDALYKTIITAGARKVPSIRVAEAVHEGGASAVALGTSVVFQTKGMGVLVNFSFPETLKRVLP